MNKKIIIPIMTLALFAAATYGSKTFAYEGSYHSDLIAEIAQRFNLNRAEVQSVFDEQRGEIRARHQEMFEQRLANAVESGQITEDQKQLIIERHEQMQEERESSLENWQNLTPEERRQANQERKGQMEAWAEENGIDFKFFGQIAGSHGPGKGLGRGMMGR